MSSPCFIINSINTVPSQAMDSNHENSSKSTKVMSYEEKTVGSTSFFKCEACPYMAFAEDDIKFHLFTFHPDLAKTNGLADNIQISCPGCSSVFDAEETLRIHLRNHHKMGVKDIKKMVKSLVQIALKSAKLKKKDKKSEPETRTTPNLCDVKMPQVIEIVPDLVTANPTSLPNGVKFISMDELQSMSTPNFEKVDPKDIIQEASLNIVYSNEITTEYVNVTNAVVSGARNIQMSNVTPDLISSVQPRHPVVDSNNDVNINLTISTDKCDSINHGGQLPKQGRPRGSKNSDSIKNLDKKEEMQKKLGQPCKVSGCYVRLNSEDKLQYHRTCHQNGHLQCLECNVVFQFVEALHLHLWREHSIDMELPTCEVCGYKTYKRHNLEKVHMKIHSDEKAYLCMYL